MLDRPPDFSHVHFGEPPDFRRLRRKFLRQLDEIDRVLAAEAADLKREREGKPPIYGVGTAIAKGPRHR